MTACTLPADSVHAAASAALQRLAEAKRVPSADAGRLRDLIRMAAYAASRGPEERISVSLDDWLLIEADL